MASKKDYYSNIIDGYIERSALIRQLSSPSVSGAYSETGFRDVFIENARKIQPLFEENERVLEEVLKPVLETDGELGTEEVEFLNGFAQRLQNNSGVEFFDASLLWRITDCLFEDALLKDDVDYLIIQLDQRIIAATGKVIQARALNDSENIWTYYQNKGREAMEMMFPYLEKEKFSTLTSQEAKEILMIDSRYFCVIYEAPNQPEEVNELIIDRLIASYEMSFDSFYTERVPDYDWVRHRIKCLEYLGQLTERNNEQGITKAQAGRILEYVMMLKDFYDSQTEVADRYISAADIDLFIAINRYYAGAISNDEYKDKLIYYYKNRFSDRLGARFMEYVTYISFQLPGEYIEALDPKNLTEEEITNIEYIYRGVIMDAFAMPNKDEFITAMEYLIRLFDSYIEIPGGISFKDFCIDFMAASMPQAFVHINSVAEITRCLTGYLLDRRPELFLGMEGTRSIEEVQKKRRDIMAYAYNGALLHDAGKIGLLPMLRVVERPTLPEEEELLYHYAISGRRLLAKSISTACYVNVIAGRHEHYDTKVPQADGYNSWKVNQKALVDIIYLAGEMDKMATQLEIAGEVACVERFLPTLEEKSGTLFAPYLCNILKVPEVQNDIDFLLSSGRDDIYRRTYVMLKGVLDRGRI